MNFEQIKNAFYTFAVLFAIAFIAACNKKGGFNAPAGQIAVSKLKVKINEPDSMALVAADSTKVTNWSVSPEGLDTLKNQRNAAIIRFTKAGDYTIKASNGTLNASVVITVIDSLFVPTPYVTQLLPGDSVTMVPKYVAAMGTASPYLGFTATTKDAYCGNSQLSFGAYFERSTGSYYAQIIEVTHPYQCGTTSSPISGHWDYSSYLNPFPNGTFPLIIFFKGSNHNGSITVTDATITFTWDPTTGVIITPTTLSR